MAISVRELFMESMKLTLITSRIPIRIRFVICSEIKFRVVSMSLVHRWIISPVWLLMCHWKGSRSIWPKSVSRMFLTSVSLARTLETRNAYRATAQIPATISTASAMIHIRPRSASAPPREAIRFRTAGARFSMDSPPMILSMVIRIIWGTIISPSEISAEQIIHRINRALLPFKNRQISFPRPFRG